MSSRPLRDWTPPMSMQGKVAVVTGSNIGHRVRDGRRPGRPGGDHGARLPQPGQGARRRPRRSRQRTWNDDVHVVPLDLADLASVRKAADDILTRWDRLDVLVNNAGGTWSERQETAQGFEYTFGVNHLGHFYLTQPAARPAAAPARRPASST